MDYKNGSTDHTTLMSSISRIERQLKIKGYEDTLSQRSNFNTLESENHKTIEGNNRTKNTLFSSMYYAQPFDENGGENPSSLKYTQDYEARKLIEKELNPYVTIVKADFKNTLNTFKEEVKEFYRNTFDLKSYQETLAANRINANRIENDTKLGFEKINKEHIDLDLVVKDLRDRFSELNRKVVQISEDVKNSSERNAMISYLEQQVSDLDYRTKSTEVYKSLEEKIMLQVKSEINTIKHNYDVKINVLTQEKSVLQQNNYSLLEEANSKANDNSKLLQTVNDLNRRINQLESINEHNSIELNQLAKMNKKSEEEVRKQNEKIDSLSYNINNLKENSAPIELKEETTAKTKELNELKEYIDTNLSQIKKTMKSDIEGIQILIEENANEITSIKGNNDNNNNNVNMISYKMNQGTEMSFNPEINEKVLTLTEQATTLQTQISTMKSDQLRLTNKLEDINKVAVSNHNLVLNKNETQFTKLKEEIGLLMTFFSQYKEEQIKLNEMYETTLKTLATQLFTLQADTKTIKQDQETYEENMETIQDNFEKIKPVMDGYPKMKSDFTLFTQIIQALTQNFDEIKKEVNNNFGTLSEWQSDLITNVTNAVNELKQDYNEKFRQSTAVITSSRFDFTNNNPSVKEDHSKTVELSNKIDTLQLLNDKKYVAKSELDNLKKIIEELEKKIKETNNEFKNTTVSQNPMISNIPIISSDKKDIPQDKPKHTESNEVFDKDQDWDF